MPAKFDFFPLYGTFVLHNSKQKIQIINLKNYTYK